MSNFDTISYLIGSMSGSGEQTLAVNKMFIKFMGDLESGVFLSQLIFYSDKSKRTDGYFYKSYKDWEEHTFLSQYKVNKITKKMVSLGFLETKIIKANGSPTSHYKFNMEHFKSLLIPFIKNLIMENEKINNPLSKNSFSLTENTTENTTENIKDNVKEEKEDLNKFKYIHQEVIIHLNNSANKNFKYTNHKTKSLINARLKEGFTLDDFKKVIDIKTKHWLNSDMSKYLRPETLFGTKFEGYLNEYPKVLEAIEQPKQQLQQKQELPIYNSIDMLFNDGE